MYLCTNHIVLSITIVVLFCVVIVYAVLFSWPCCYFFRSFLLQLFVLFNFISYHFFYSPYLCFLVVLFVVVILFKVSSSFEFLVFHFVLCSFCTRVLRTFASENFLNSSSVSFFPLPDFPSFFLYSFPRFSLYFFLSVFFFLFSTLTYLYVVIFSLITAAAASSIPCYLFNGCLDCCSWPQTHSISHETVAFGNLSISIPTPLLDSILIRLFGIDCHAYLESISTSIWHRFIRQSSSSIFRLHNHRMALDLEFSGTAKHHSFEFVIMGTTCPLDTNGLYPLSDGLYLFDCRLGSAVVSSLRNVPKPGYTMAPHRSHTFSSTGATSQTVVSFLWTSLGSLKWAFILSILSIDPWISNGCLSYLTH